jgi:hypothetical protein
VRTVQRWERDYQLPVHRLGCEGGEIIWAESAEIDEWLRSQAASTAAVDAEAPAAPVAGRTEPEPFAERVALERATSRLRIGATLVATLLAVAAWSLWPSTPPPLADWQIENGNLIGLDRNGQQLWSRTFDMPLAADTFNRGACSDPRLQGRRVLLHDCHR